MTLLIIYFTIAISISFLCSLLEATLLSITPAYLHSLKGKGKTYGKRLLKLKEDVDKSLSAILSLNTIAHTVGAAGVGAQAALVFGDQYIGVISAVLTFLILVLSEIIPKSLGANYWKDLAGFTSYALVWVIYLMYPLVVLSKVLTNLLSPKGTAYSTSREEVVALARIGRQEGLLKENEVRILQNLMFFQSVKVEDIMTPRTVILAADQEMSLQEFFRNKDFLRFSRIPVYKENMDNIKGYVLKSELLEMLANDKFDLKLKEIQRTILTIYEKIPIPALFDMMIQKREHIALAVDEYGGVAGIVTMEDLIETLLGTEIVDELDRNIDMQQLAREKWKIRARRLGIISDKESS